MLHNILGNMVMGGNHIQKIISSMREGVLYVGSNGSENNGHGAHTFGFTSSEVNGPI